MPPHYEGHVHQRAPRKAPGEEQEVMSHSLWTSCIWFLIAMLLPFTQALYRTLWNFGSTRGCGWPIALYTAKFSCKPSLKEYFQHHPIGHSTKACVNFPTYVVKTQSTLTLQKSVYNWCRSYFPAGRRDAWVLVSCKHYRVPLNPEPIWTLMFSWAPWVIDPRCKTTFSRMGCS